MSSYISGFDTLVCSLELFGSLHSTIHLLGLHSMVIHCGQLFFTQPFLHSTIQSGLKHIPSLTLGDTTGGQVFLHGEADIWVTILL